MPSNGFDTIPIIDFATAESSAELADELRAVAHEVGFFIAVNHPVAQSMIDDVFTMMTTFFALPEEHKLLIDKRRSPHFRGWEAVGTERTNNRPDFREQIDLWSEWPAVTGSDDSERLLGPNQWMPEALIPGQGELMADWFRQMASFADEILALLSSGLGLRPDHLKTYFGPQPMSLTKLISYPPTPPGSAGVNAHHDTGFLTLLAAGTTPGLQVQNSATDWIDVPCVEGGLVVNLGEMLQAVTGSYFLATPHRVVTSEARLSAGYFHGPSLQTRLDLLPLAATFSDAVAASPRHLGTGYMAQATETESGVGDMASEHRPDTYGQQLWNYFARSYPEMMAEHHGA